MSLPLLIALTATRESAELARNGYEAGTLDLMSFSSSSAIASMSVTLSSGVGHQGG